MRSSRQNKKVFFLETERDCKAVRETKKHIDTGDKIRSKSVLTINNIPVIIFPFGSPEKPSISLRGLF